MNRRLTPRQPAPKQGPSNAPRQATSAQHQGSAPGQQGGSAPQQGGSAPRQGGSAPRQGGSAPRQGGAAPRKKGLSGKPRVVKIESIAAGGAGLARDEGRAVFVPRTAPGDEVEITLEPRSGAVYGKVLRLVTPGPDRIQPTCSFVETCGGCDLMHLTAAAQSLAHLQIVTSALEHHVTTQKLPPIVTRHVYDSPPSKGDPAQQAPSPGGDSAQQAPSPEGESAQQAPSPGGDSAQQAPSPEGEPAHLAPFHYRTRARFFARVERNKPLVGYRAAGSHSIAPIERCAVLVPPLNDVLRDLPDVLKGARGDGEISVSLGEGGRPVVDFAWRGEIPADVWARLDQKTKSAWAGARVWLDGAATPASFGDPRPVLEGADGRPLVIAAGGFAQPSERAAIALARHVQGLVKRSGDSLHSIVELFAGSGTLSVLLAPLCKRFVAVESVEPAAVCARKNLESRGLTGKVVVADANDHDPAHADVVVLDPPRTGARAAAQKIASSATKSVVYVGCDPTTTARDTAILTAAGFTITDIELIEIFPQTSHIETLVRLTRKRG